MTPAEVDELDQNPENSPWMPRQEPGIRNSNALFYELLIEEKFDPGKEVFSLRMEAGKNNFGEKSLGAAFNVFAPGRFNQKNSKGEKEMLPVKFWSFATEAGDHVNYNWNLNDFEIGRASCRERELA